MDDDSSLAMHHDALWFLLTRQFPTFPRLFPSAIGFIVASDCSTADLAE
jgi:hypothetical protein